MVDDPAFRHWSHMSQFEWPMADVLGSFCIWSTSSQFAGVTGPT